MTDAPINPNVFPEASVRADRLTPEVVGRRVHVETDDAVVIGTVLGYRIEVESDVVTFAGRPVGKTGSVHITLHSIGEVRVLLGAEVKVLV